MYKLLLIGELPKSLEETKLNDCKGSLQMTTFILAYHFKRLIGDNLIIKHARDIDTPYPIADYVIWGGFTAWWKKTDVERLRRETGCKKIVHVGEKRFANVELNYVYRGKISKNDVHVPHPVEPSYYTIKPKVKNSVLVDHIWETQIADNRDWTLRIREWLKGTEFDITQFINSKREKRFFGNDKFIGKMGFCDYLKATDTFETLVITHAESYGYGVIDMIVRGIRVLAPENALRPGIIDGIDIGIFNDKESLLKLLRQPANGKSQIDKCTPFANIVQQLHKEFKQC